MGALKWIGGILGWASSGPIGALIGYLIGSALEKRVIFRQLETDSGWEQTGPGTYSRQYGTGNGSGKYTADQQRNSFMASLLVLCSAVIRADGRLLQSEFDYVRNFIRNNFGEQTVNEAIRILNDLNSKEINIYSVGSQISANMNYSQRLQLFHYLAELANADGELCKQERDVLESIASATGINRSDADSVLAMFRKSEDSAYSVLGISPDSTDDEIKSAYRRMAMKYHPDKVASLGPDVQKAAEQKFRKIQEAYESIKRQRGIK